MMKADTTAENRPVCFDLSLNMMIHWQETYKDQHGICDSPPGLSELRVMLVSFDLVQFPDLRRCRLESILYSEGIPISDGYTKSKVNTTTNLYPCQCRA